MAKEPDQTKWVGIRPTDPSEDIPVTSRKRWPAIGDLQAIKDNYCQEGWAGAANCTVAYALNLSTVDPGEIWVITAMAIRNVTSMCDMQAQAHINGVNIPLKTFYSIEPDSRVSWSGIVVLKEGEYVRAAYYLGGAADVINVWGNGYKIEEY